MSETTIPTVIKPISEVKRVYSGKPGCMCGCNGNYWPEDRNAEPSEKDKKTFNRIYKIFQKNPDLVFTYPNSKDEFVFCDFSDSRIYVMYY